MPQTVRRSHPSPSAEGCYAAGMVLDRSPDDTQARLTWALVVIAVGAIIGIGTTAALLARKGRPLPDDPDAPLFI